MGRHSSRKFLKKELNKVKFKIGKKLPKNLNETRPEFKAKKLIIKQQFQLEKDGPVSHRNLSLKELLIHLNHHNQSIRLDAVNSLKEMLQKNFDYMINNELNQLLEAICPLFVDREYKIRKLINELLKQLFSQLISTAKNNDLTRLKPFYRLLNAHLSCAMTHIDENIQYNSLIILDIFIQYLPNLIFSHSYNIFENFIEQISKIATSSANTSSFTSKKHHHHHQIHQKHQQYQSPQSQCRRVLKNDPYKLTSTQSWRSNVLLRLYKLLLIVSSSSSSPSSLSNSSLDENNTNINNSETNNNIIKFNELTECIFKLIDPNTTIINRETIKTSKRLINTKNVSDVETFFLDYIPVIGPLLIDCWIEAKPEDSNVVENSESFEIMHSVLLILNHMLKHLNIGFTQALDIMKISKKSTNYIESTFLADFPYLLSEGYKKTNNGQVPSIVSINLLLCKLCISSVLELSNEKLVSILEYCLNLFNTNNDSTKQQLSNNELIVILNLSQTIFDNFSSPELIKPFLNCLLEYFDKAPVFSMSKLITFEFLIEQFFKHEKLTVDNQKCFIKFFAKSLKYCIWHEKEKKLDKLESLFDNIRKQLLRKQANILKCFQDEYINMLNAMDFEDENTNDSCKKKLIELIHYMPKVNNYLLTKLSIIIINKKISFGIVNQILGILKIKFEANEDDEPNTSQTCSSSDYLMFLLTLFHGYTGFDLTSTLPDLYSSNRNIDMIIVDEDKLAYHFSLCQHLIQFVMSHSNSNQIIDVLLATSIPVITSLQYIPLSTIYGLLVLISEIDISTKTDNDKILILIHSLLQWCSTRLNQINSYSNPILKIIKQLKLILNKNSNYICRKIPGLNRYKTMFENYSS